MALTNRTKVAIAVVGTEDAYSKMFTHLRTARRLGNIISGNLYCDNRAYFGVLARQVFSYQWFDEPVALTSDMLDALYRNTHGIIDQLIGLCMYLNLDYISAKKRPNVDADYINKTARRHYRGIQKLMDQLEDSLNEKKRQQIVEEANKKLDNLLQEHKQAAFAEKITADEAADKELLPLKKNVIRNIQMVMDDYSAEKIAIVIDKVFETNKDIDEKTLTRVVVKYLTETDKPEPKKAPRKKKGKSLTPDMVKFILD